MSSLKLLFQSLRVDIEGKKGGESEREVVEKTAEKRNLKIE